MKISRNLGLLALLVSILCSACQQPPKIRTAKAELAAVEQTVSSVNSGSVKSEQVAELSFGAVGRVRVLNISVGAEVKQGQILAELENGDLKSALDTSERELHRLDDLVRSRAMAEQQRDVARREYSMALGAYEKSIIRAPFDGLITELNLEVGQLSQITAVIPKPLMKIVDNKPRYITAEIDEVDLAKVHPGQAARVKILAQRKEAFAAKVRRVVPYVSSIREQDRTVEIELDIVADDLTALLPVGASADVEIIVANKDKALSVPSRTIIGHGQSRLVFIIDQGRLKKREVKLGLFNYDRSEILEGVSLGDRLAFPSENLELTDGMKVSIDQSK